MRSISKALGALPNNTVVDGEIVALDEEGRPSFNLLQNHGSTHPQLYYYVFDVVIASGKDMCGQTLEARLDILHSRILPKLSEPIRPYAELEAGLPNLVRSVREQQLEGLVAKRRDSVYEPGRRSGAWQKMRINQGRSLSSVIHRGRQDVRCVGSWVLRRRQAAVCSRTRNGFTPALREQLCRRMKPLQIKECLFANLPKGHGGRWGQGLTAAKMNV